MDNQEVTKFGYDATNEMHALTTEQVLKTIVIKPGNDGTNRESKQIEDEFIDMYDNEAIEPPYNPLLWASLMEKNTRLAKLIRTYARNSVGLGWRVKSKKPITKQTSEKDKKLIEKEKEMLEEFFENANPYLPVEEIFYRAKIDEESMGNGYIEVVRGIESTEDSKVGVPVGLYHVPGHTVRIMKNLKGYVQIRGGKKRFFKVFNGNFDIDMNDGTVHTLGSLPIDRRANELIHFSIYTPRSSYYGIPRYTSTADAIAGNKLASRRNLAFFKNDATPRMAITVTNGQLTGSSIKDIKDFVNTEGKGVENSHRVMILQAQAKQVGDMNQKDVKIDVIPLTVGQTDDASFISYRNANDEELRESFGIGEVFLGAKGSVNRATATVSRQITNEQEFIPDAKVKEYYINQTVCKAFGVKKVKFEFERPSSLDEIDKADIYSKYLQGGGITPNDIRHEIGKNEYEEDWGDKPLQIGLVEYQMGVLAAQGAVSQGGKVDENGQSQSDNQDSQDDTTNNEDSKQQSTDKKVKMIIDNINKMLAQQLPHIVIDFGDENK